MSKLKPITEFSDEDLLKLISATESDGSNFEFSYKNDILDFISHYGIKQGDFPIPTKLLYKLYRKWSFEPVKQITFTTEMTDLFPSEKYVIKINKSNLILKDEIYNFHTRRNKTKMRAWGEHFKNYINKYSLKKGGFAVKDIVLYNLYDKWVYSNNNKHPLSFLQFRKFLEIWKFKVKRTRKGQWFYVHHSIKEHMSEDLLNLMRKK